MAMTISTGISMAITTANTNTIIDLIKNKNPLIQYTNIKSL
jgi:hypothetical protein